MYYFYINFPNFNDRTILIHHGTCGRCQNGNGQRGSGTNAIGFWAGPFQTYNDAHGALTKLIRRFQNPPNIDDCGACI
jgi:hypothetical protein